MRLLVIGGSGLVGSHILAAAQASGHAAVGTYRQQAQPGLESFDGADAARFEALLEQHRPDAVVHAAGWTWVDGCEDDPPRAMRENSEQPSALAARCALHGIRFCYVSTSYVFDGKAGPYAETDTPCPINTYARSKWAGETGVMEATGGSALIPRVICVYGAESLRKNFAYQILKAMREGKTLTLPGDQRGNPSWAGDIARWLVRLLERRETGCWNLAGPQPDCTRPEWAEMLLQAFRAQGIQPHPQFGWNVVSTAELGQKAPRPLHAGMWTRKLGNEDPPTDFCQTIERMLAEQRGQV
jgi:dTDP-4-dehydrorhamnose reductase